MLFRKSMNFKDLEQPSFSVHFTHVVILQRTLLWNLSVSSSKSGTCAETDRFKPFGAFFQHISSYASVLRLR